MSSTVAVDSDLGVNLRRILGRRTADGLARPSFCPNLAPSLAYGRHRGPARDASRRAAVAIALFQRDGQWMIPLTLRPTSLQHHGGQICLPGGQIEPDESITDAALREYEEELGVKPVVSVHCGQLSPMYVFGSDNRVFPAVVTTQTPSDQWRPDPVEVAEVITLPLAELLKSTNRTSVTKSRSVRQNGHTVGHLNYAAPAIEFDNHLIWGATALILDELAQLLQSTTN